MSVQLVFSTNERFRSKLRELNRRKRCIRQSAKSAFEMMLITQIKTFRETQPRLVTSY